MLFTRKRVDEDLEKIRLSNLSPENRIIEKNKKYEKINNEKLVLEKNDLLAMILAVLSLILPYIFIFVAIMSIIIMLLYYIY